MYVDDVVAALLSRSHHSGKADFVAAIDEGNEADSEEVDNALMALCSSKHERGIAVIIFRRAIDLMVGSLDKVGNDSVAASLRRQVQRRRSVRIRVMQIRPVIAQDPLRDQ